MFFNFDLVVQVVGSASDESDTVVEVQKSLCKKKNHCPPQRTQKTLNRKEAFEQEPDQVEDIEPPMKKNTIQKNTVSEQVPKQFEETKVISEVKHTLSEEKALNANAMRFYCMPFSLSQPNSLSLLLATVSTPCSVPCLFSCFFPLSQHRFELLVYVI